MLSAACSAARRSRAARCSWRASRPWGGSHVAPRATAPSLPDTPRHDSGSTRCGAAPWRSSTRTDPRDERSHAPRHAGRTGSRSPPARRRTNNAPTAEPTRSAASRQPAGTISTRPPATPQLQQRQPRSTPHRRSTARIGPGPHAAPPMAGPATTSGHASHEPLPDACQHPSRTTSLTRCCNDQLNPPMECCDEGLRTEPLFLGSPAPRQGPGSHDAAGEAQHAHPCSAPRPCPHRQRVEQTSSATSAATRRAHRRASGSNDRCSATA